MNTWLSYTFIFGFCCCKQGRSGHPLHTPLRTVPVLLKVELLAQRAMYILNFDRFCQIVFQKRLYQFVLPPEVYVSDSVSSQTLGLVSS